MKISTLILLLISTSVWALPVMKPVECRLLCLQSSKNALSALVVGPRESSITCDLPSEEFSRPIELTAVDSRIEFRSAQAPDGKPVAVAKLPPGFDGGLLVFLPTAGDDSMPLYKILVLDDSIAALPRDGSFIYNASPANLRYFIGEHGGAPKPGQVTAISRPEKRNEYQMSGVRFQIQSGEIWRTTYESIMRFPENQHRLFVAFVDPVSKLPALRILRFNPR